MTLARGTMLWNHRDMVRPRAARRLLLAVFAATIGGGMARPAQADELKVGMSGALSGPAAALGLGMKRGIDAYFERVNAAGGVHGHTLRLVAMEIGRAH